jgi:hypothetical protein
MSSGLESQTAVSVGPLPDFRLRGFESGEDDHTVWLRCVYCGEPLVFSAAAEMSEIRASAEAHRCLARESR